MDGLWPRTCLKGGAGPQENLWVWHAEPRRATQATAGRKLQPQFLGGERRKLLPRLSRLEGADLQNHAGAGHAVSTRWRVFGQYGAQRYPCI